MALTLPSPSSFGTAVDNTKSHNKPLDEFPRSMTCRPPHRQSSYGQLKAKSSSQSHPHEATFERATDQRPEHLHRLQDGGHNGSAATRVPVYVMLPLDTVSPNGGGLTCTRALNASLMALRSAGVEGVMVDVWWELVKKDGPLRYNWDSYTELVKMVWNN